jgi:SAM-dependent methyltransferase
MLNPHFDEDIVVWQDSYSGNYLPVNYDIQFDYEWKLFLNKKIGFCKHTGVEIDDKWINDRIFELTGIRHYIETKKYGKNLGWIIYTLKGVFGDGEKRRTIGGRLLLQPKFSSDHFQGKRCLDVGCGAGRWTKTLIALGAQVKSVDVSEHALVSTRRLNNDVEYLNLFDIIDKRPDLHECFDFTMCWGVVQHTHDPKLAFENVARSVTSHGELYTMIYAPGYHNSEDIVNHRKHFHRNLKTIEEKLQYAYDISDSPENCINQFDMLNTFYNWVIPEEVIYNWYRITGFDNIITLNAQEKDKCAFHIIGTKL